MFPLIEPLEARIAPATVLNPYTVTFTDENGDTAVIKTSRPIFQNATLTGDVLGFSAGAVSGTQSLDYIDFTGTNASSADAAKIQALASGINLTVKVLPRAGRANLPVDVGYIKAADFNFNQFQVTNGVDLGVVTIDGNLGHIDAGDVLVGAAVRALNVGSMKNNATDGFFTSHFLGGVSSIRVSGDVDGASLQMLGNQFGNLGALRIGGALRGAGDAGTGQIVFTGSLGTAVIGEIAGGAGDSSGLLAGISSPGRLSTIGSVQLTGSQDSNLPGSLLGGSGPSSGLINAPLIGAVLVHGSVEGGSGVGSGQIAGSTRIGAVNIAHDLSGGTAGGSGTAGDSGAIIAPNVRSISIGGSILGGTFQDSGHNASSSGFIKVSGALKTLRIGGDIAGGSGAASGTVSAATLGTLLLGGSIAGGNGAGSGHVDGSSFGHVGIGKNIQGGAGAGSGGISAKLAVTSSFDIIPGQIGSLFVGGDIAGGAANSSGAVLVSGGLGKTVIGGSVRGGAAASAAALFQSGYIQAGTIFNLTVDGDVTAGTNSGAGSLVVSSGAIRSTGVIGGLLVKGSLQGNTSTGGVLHSAIISAAGEPAADGAKTNVAINAIAVLGNMDRAEILAGYNAPASGSDVNGPRGAAANADAQINAVFLGKNLSASSIVAGATAGADKFFGNADDHKAGGNDVSTILSKISSIIVAGTATGSLLPTEHFGFEAQNVVSVSVNGQAVALTPGAENDDVALSPAGNLSVFEKLS